MAVPNYTYLKLKMSSPHGVIAVGTSFQRAYECKVECCVLALAIIASEELVIIKEGITEEAPDSKRSIGSFEPTEGTKEVLIDPSSSEGKWCASAPCSPTNRKARSSASFVQTETSLRGNPRTCQAFRGKSPSMP
jgi:hypothetical protein